MADVVKVLILEDYPQDAELNQHEVKKVLPRAQFYFADSKESFLEAIDKFKPDVILSDYKLPGFNGMDALMITNEQSPDTPFLLITGPMNEEIAVECMKAGAWDYVLKDRYMRIGPAVINALEQKKLRFENRKAIQDLRESEARYRNLVMYSPDAIFVNLENRIILVNQACVKMFHASSENDLIGKSPYDLFSPEYHDQIKDRIHKMREYGKPLSVVTEKIIRLDGSKVDVDVVAAPFAYYGIHAIHVILRDISERKMSEEKLRSSLKEKETLLQEIYHRTKNNMQVISALLELQAAASGNIEVEHIIHDSTTRIRTMALAHEKLYKSKSLSRVYMREYILGLVQLLVSSNKVDTEKITVQYDIEEIEFLIDIAIPCGLIINELLSNAFKYAFPFGRKGTIILGLHRKKEKQIELTVIDNGVGLPEGFDIMKAPSLGIQLVLQIVNHQLHGSAKVESTHGIKWCILFREDLYKERI